jgi:thiamine-phosphate pyrophosphorylase
LLSYDEVPYSIGIVTPLNIRFPKIYPITDTGISGLTHLQQAERLISGGAKIIQLRDKTATSAEFFRSAVETVDLCRQHGVTIIINDRVDIALLSGADGVHLGQDDIPPDAARKILGENAMIGLSTHSVEQIRAAIAQPVDYLAIGPIFSTATKDDHDPIVGLDGIRSAKREAGEIPLIAIGGIDAANLLAVLDAGADSAAVISVVARDAAKMAALSHLVNQNFVQC